MPIAMQTLASARAVAIFDVDSFNPTTFTGDRFDIDDPLNDPVKNPEDNLDKIYFHSDLNLLEVADDGDTSISHSAVSSGSTAGGTRNGSNQAYEWKTTFTEHVLATHNLGYPPISFVAVNGDILNNGETVQIGTGSADTARYMSYYVTNTQLIIREYASAGLDSLSSTSISYDYIILRDPRTASGNTLRKYTASTGILELGYGKFSSDRKYLQVSSEGSPFALPLGKNMDGANGAVRIYNADGSYYEPVSSVVKYAVYGQIASVNYGPSFGYNGSASAPAVVEFIAP